MKTIHYLSIVILLLCFAHQASAQGIPQFPDLKSTEFITTSSGLRIWVTAPGAGSKAVKGQKAYTFYAGWLENGVVFDSNTDGGKAFKFSVGAKEVIPGWDEAIMHLAPGGKAYILVPAALGYGNEGIYDLIPGGATLVFYLELVKLK